MVEKTRIRDTRILMVASLVSATALTGIDVKLALQHAIGNLNNLPCSHYRRRCQIRAPCCNEVFDCRHCHNEAKNSMDVHPLDRHDVPRHEVQKVICSLCRTEQDVQQTCVTCGVCMGKYFCEKCNFFDDEDSKQQYHCDGCGICRTGGNDNFFHCYKCGCCYSILLKDCHPCVEKAMHHNCPVCFEYLFDSTKLISVLPCGHTIHMHCLKEMHEHLQFACPVCSKSVCDMSKLWEKLDREVDIFDKMNILKSSCNGLYKE